MSRQRDITIAVKARDEFTSTMKKAESAMDRFRQAQQRTQQRRGDMEAANAAVRDSAKAYNEAAAEAERYGKILNNTGAANRRTVTEQGQIRASFEASRQKAQQLKQALQQKKVALQQLRGVNRGSFADFNRKATAIENAANAARREDAVARKLGGTLRRVGQESRRAASDQNRLRDAARQTSDAMRRQNGVADDIAGAYATRQGRGPLGLRPYELTNLGYQVNDIVTGLAMGQPPAQVFAQQIGQIIQIFPRATTAVLRFTPAIAALSAVFGPLIGNMAAARREATALADMERRLALFADAGEYTAEVLADIAGNSEEAQQEVMGLVQRGFRQDRLEEFLGTARQIAEVMGIEAAEGVELLRDAFVGGLDGLRELDEQINVFTASEMEMIAAHYEAGEAALAQEAAIDALQARLEGVTYETTNWDRIASALSGTWSNLLDLFKDSYLQNTFEFVLRNIGDALVFVAEGMERVSQFVSGPDLNPFEERMQELQQAEAVTRLRLEETERRRDAMGPMGSQAERDSLDQRIADLEARLAAIQAEMTTVESTMAGAETGEVDPGLIELGQDEYLQRSNQLMAAARQAAEAIREEGAAITQTNQQREVTSQLIELENQARELGIRVTDEMRQVIEDAVAAKYDDIEASERIEAAERTVEGAINSTRTARENANAAIERARQAVQVLTAAYGENSDVVIAAQDALARLEAQANGTAAAINNLNAAIAALTGGAAAIPGRAAQLIEDINFRAEMAGADAITRGVRTFERDVIQGLQRDRDAAIAAAEEAGVMEPVVLAGITESYEQGIAELEAVLPGVREAYQNLTQAEEAAAAARRAARGGGGGGGGGGSAAEEELTAVEQMAEREQQINQLIQHRRTLLENLEAYRERGDTSMVEQTEQQIAAVDQQLQQAIDSAISFWQAMGGPEAEQAIARLENMRLGLEEVGETAIITGDQINERLADIGVNALDAMAQAIARGENAWDAFFNAFLQGAAEFLLEIAKMIAQQAILNALRSFGVGSGIAGGLGRVMGGIFHQGGTIGTGSAAPSRSVPAALFSNARRMHDGGMVGDSLRANEVPIIAEVGEEMLTRDDPRHSANGGGANIRNINVFDPSDALEAALETTRGEQVVLNWLTRNSRAAKSALG